MEKIFWFLYSWLIVFWLRSQAINSAKLISERISIAELKALHKNDSDNFDNFVPLSDFFDDTKFIFSPNFFDKWTPKQFVRFAIESRINAGQDIIFKNADKYYDVL